MVRFPYEASIARFHSMTKPITCAAAMMCYERGCFQMEDPVEVHLPEWRGARVWDGGRLVRPRRRPRIKHLFMHTAGIDARGGPALYAAQGAGASGEGRAELVAAALAADDR
eukprot:gene1147-4592_t